MKKQPPSPLVLLYFLSLLFLATVLMGWLLWPFVSSIILSYLLATMFDPVYRALNRRMSAQLASLVTCGLIVVLIFVPVTFFVGALSREAYDLFQMTKDVDLAGKFNHFVEGSALLAGLKGMLARYGISIEVAALGAELSRFGGMFALFVYNQASAWAANILHFLFNFFMMVIIIFFLLIDRGRFLNFITRLSPLPDEHEKRLISKFEEISTAILIGNGTCGLIQGVMGGMVFAFLGFSSPVIWGLVMGILAFLPIVGIALVMWPATLLLLLQGEVGKALLLIAVYIILTLFVEYMLKTKLVGGTVKMHLLLVFLAIIGGLQVFGVMGIIYGPMIVTGFLTLADIYMVEYDKCVKSIFYWKEGISPGDRPDEEGL
jgi:predicted PurR-regulated permease PerM